MKKNDSYRTIKILGVRVDFLNLPQAASRVENWVKSNKQHQITTPNPEHIVMAQSDYRFKNIINNSSLSVADGIGLVWAAKTLNSNYRGLKLRRLSGVDLMFDLSRLAAVKKWRVFLLGGKNDAAAKAAASLTASCGLTRVAYHPGAVDINNEDRKEHDEVIKQINKFSPDLLFVAYGAPMQEKWLKANLTKLNAKVAVGVGGAFDYLAGKVGRAPKWARKTGLEWLWRLIREPWRWKRQLRLIKFIFLVFKAKILKN